MNSYVCIDLENTGLSPRHDKIIEIGAVKVSEGAIVETFSSFVNPGRVLDENITKLTGISDEDLKDALQISEILPKFLEFVGDYQLLGHHVISDFAFIKKACVNMKISFEKEAVDTLRIARACLMELPSKRLSDLCEYYKIEMKAHRALNDALATVELYNALRRDFLDKEPSLFVPQKLRYQAKKETPIRKAQIIRLNMLIERYGIDCPYEISRMSCNEASRYIDQILAKYKGV